MGASVKLSHLLLNDSIITYMHAQRHACRQAGTNLAPHNASVASSLMVKMWSASECALLNLRAEAHAGTDGSAQLLAPDITISYVCEAMIRGWGGLGLGGGG